MDGFGAVATAGLIGHQFEYVMINYVIYVGQFASTIIVNSFFKVYLILILDW